MRLAQLAVGDRFIFEGQVYVKTGPISASSETGESRMIPRHAMLQPVNVTAPVVQGEASALDAVEAAFNRFCSDLAGPLATAGLSDTLVEAQAGFLEQLASIRTQLASAQGKPATRRMTVSPIRRDPLGDMVG